MACRNSSDMGVNAEKQHYIVTFVCWGRAPLTPRIGCPLTLVMLPTPLCTSMVFTMPTGPSYSLDWSSAAQVKHTDAISVWL